MLAIEYHVYIWQVSPQLSCGDACQILMWYKDPNRYFGRIENLAYEEINERSFSNPHPSTWTLKCLHTRTHRSTITCYIHEIMNRATTLQWQNTSVMVPQITANSTVCTTAHYETKHEKSALLAICVENPHVTEEFPSQGASNFKICTLIIYMYICKYVLMIVSWKIVC